MERVLTLSKQYGTLDFQSNDMIKKQREFADANWGSSARGWAQKTALMTGARWDCIIYDARAFTANVDEDDIGAAANDDGEVDPRSLVELDW